MRIESGRAVYQKTFGDKAAKPERSPMTADTIFDAASLTKVIATAPAIALLIEQGKMGLDDRVEKWIPSFKKNGKGAVTIRHLLTHTSGLRAGLSPRPEWSGVATAIAKASRRNRSPNSLTPSSFTATLTSFYWVRSCGRLGERLDLFCFKIFSNRSA